MKKTKRSITKAKYQEELQDERWLDLRQIVIRNAGGACECCGKICQDLHAHHTFYKPNAKAWDYKPTDLCALCRDCHEDFHKSIKWLSKEISEIHPVGFLKGLRGCGYLMADTIAEISGRLAQLSWLEIRKVPLE